MFSSSLAAPTQEEALELNKLVVKEEIFCFLWETIQKLAFSKQQFESSIVLFKTILKFFSKSHATVYVFKVSDLII